MQRQEADQWEVVSVSWHFLTSKFCTCRNNPRSQKSRKTCFLFITSPDPREDSTKGPSNWHTWKFISSSAPYTALLKDCIINPGRKSVKDVSISWSSSFPNSLFLYKVSALNIKFLLRKAKDFLFLFSLPVPLACTNTVLSLRSGALRLQRTFVSVWAVRNGALW